MVNINKRISTRDRKKAKERLDNLDMIFGCTMILSFILMIVFGACATWHNHGISILSSRTWMILFYISMVSALFSMLMLAATAGIGQEGTSGYGD